MRISDWSSDVCSSDLDPAGSMSRLRRGRRSRRARSPFPSPLAHFVVASPMFGERCRGLVYAARALPDLRMVRTPGPYRRSDEHTSELQFLMRTSYAAFCVNKKTDQIAIYSHT